MTGYYLMLVSARAERQTNWYKIRREISKQNSEDLPAITNDFLFHHRCAVLIYWSLRLLSSFVYFIFCSVILMYNEGVIQDRFVSNRYLVTVHQLLPLRLALHWRPGQPQLSLIGLLSLLSAYLLRLEGNQTREAGRDKATEDWARAQTTSSLTPSSYVGFIKDSKEESQQKKERRWMK